MSPETRADDAAMRLAEASQAAEASAGRMSAAFEMASQEILSAIETAASGGAQAIDSMVENMLQALARLVLDEFVFSPFEGFIEGLSQNIIGARAEGGPVQAGARYLVGERGPEVFTPGAAGMISPSLAAPTVNITIHAGSGSAADQVRRSERQIAAAIARAVRQGSRSL